MPEKKTLLLVEDEAAILFSVQRILELSGNYEVITATNGKVGIDKLKMTIPDLIISDIGMPEMDGIEFCRQVRADEATRSIPFIFLTGQRDRVLEGIQTGSDDCIMKPFKVDELIIKITSIFERIESRREEALIQKGDLKDYTFDEILQLCNNEAFSGEMVMRKGDEEGIILLNRGEIEEIKYRDLDEDESLDTLRKWQEGSFVLRPKTIKIKSKKNDKAKEAARKEALNLEEAVQIADDTWWIGQRNADAVLQTNVYLRQFKGANKVINTLFNPGQTRIYADILKKAKSLITDISNIHLYHLDQQDAYITGNVAAIKTANPKAICVTTEGNWQSQAAYEIDEKTVKFVNKMKDWRVKLATGNELIYVSTPFCSSRNTFLTYDNSTRILYSGELFSSILSKKNYHSFWLDDTSLDGIVAYHQVHMPTAKAIRFAIMKIRLLDPQPLIIAPLFGHLIRGDQVSQVIEKLDGLEVGTDLLNVDDNSK